MNKGLKIISTVALAAAANLALAAPSALVVDNQTDVQVRAYVNGISKNPAEPHSTMSLSWFALKVACMFATDCKAEVKADTKSNTPISLGYASINLKTGIINTSGLDTSSGYRVTYLSPGHAQVTKD